MRARWAVVLRQGYAGSPQRRGPIIRREDTVTRLGARARARALAPRPTPVVAGLGPMWHVEVLRRADADLLEARVGNAS